MPATTGYAVSNITALKAIDNTVRVDGYMRSVTSERAWFIFIAAASDTADDVNIIAPTSGTGRWFKVKSFTLPTDISGLTEYVQDVVGTSFLQSGAFTVTYNDPSNTVSLTLNNNIISDTHVATNAAIAQSKIANLVSDLAGKASSNHTHASTQISDFAEAVDDRIAALLTSPNGSITFNYNDATNVLEIQTVASNPSVAIKEDGTAKGSVTGLNFAGSAVDVSVAGNEATVTISAPSSVTVENIIVTSASLASNAEEIKSFAAFPLGFFTRLQTDFPARIRIYLTNAYAIADQSRPVSSELFGEHGCFLECVTIGSNLILDLSPPANFYSVTGGNLLYMTITNTDSVSRVITTTLTLCKW